MRVVGMLVPFIGGRRYKLDESTHRADFHFGWVIVKMKIIMDVVGDLQLNIVF